MFHNHTILDTVRVPYIVPVTGGGPIDIFGGNLVAWWDADAGLPSGVAPDQSGNGHPLTAAGSVAPTIGTLNGFPAYYFSIADVATGCLSCGSVGSLSFPGLGGAGAVFAVLSVNSSAGSGMVGRVFSAAVGGAENTNLNSWTAFTYVDAPHGLDTGANSAFTGALSAWTAGENIIACFAFDAGNLYTYKNNVQIGSTTSTGGTMNVGGGAGGGSTSFMLGNTPNAPALASCFSGVIGAAFVINQTPDSTYRTLAYNYLKDKFGL